MAIAAAFVYTRTLHAAANYDEGNYLGSLDALRHGQTLGTDVFLDQPPGWYLLLHLLSFVLGNSVTGIRVGMVALALVGLGAAYAIGRGLGGHGTGVATMAVLAFASPYPSEAAQVEADPASTVLALAALALGVWAYRRRTRPGLAAAAGAVLMLAISVKLLAATAVLPLAGLALLGSGPRLRRIVPPLVGAGTVLLAFTIAYVDRLSEVWQGVVGAHLHARSVQFASSSNVHRMVYFLDPRTPFAWIVAAGVAAAVTLALRGHAPRGQWALWLWVPATVAFLLELKPLLDHHLVVLAAALAVPAGSSLGLFCAQQGRRVAAGLALTTAAFIAAAFVQEEHRLVRNDQPEPASVEWAVHEVRARTTPGELVVSDLPIVPYLARRQMPGQLIDTSIARVGTGYLPAAEVLRLIDASGVRLVVVGRMFTNVPAIVTGLERRFPRRIERDGIRIYLRR